MAGTGSLRGLNAYQRHQQLVHNYLAYYGGKLPPGPSAASSSLRTDWDVLRENHRQGHCPECLQPRLTSSSFIKAEEMV